MNEQISAMIDDQLVDEQLLDELLDNEECQATFSRYHLIGDVMRDEVSEQLLNIDISEQLMAKLEEQPIAAPLAVVDTSVNETTKQPENNVLSFSKRFGQYAIAATVAGVVVVSSLMTSQPMFENNSNGLEVLKTVPFGGATPVSLQATQKQSLQTVKERNERLDALLKDHQLQLQIQP